MARAISEEELDAQAQRRIRPRNQPMEVAPESAAPPAPAPALPPSPAPAPAPSPAPDMYSGYRELLDMVAARQPSAQPAPAPAAPSPAPATAPQGTPPAPGWVWYGTGWAPPDHPLAQQAARAPAATQAPSAAPVTPEATAAAAVPSPDIMAQVGQSLAGAASMKSPEDAAFEQQVRDKVLSLMATNPDQASINDADLKPVADTARLARQRSFENERARLAEHFGSQGYGSSGAMDLALQSGLENMGTGQADFEANLVANKLSERRGQLVDALKMGAGLLSEDQRNRLQGQLATLDAALQREQLASQERLGLSGQAIDRELGLAGIGSRENIAAADRASQDAESLRNLGFNFYNRNLGNQEFNDQLGFNIGQTEAEMNRQAILDLLYGGQ